MTRKQTLTKINTNSFCAVSIMLPRKSDKEIIRFFVHCVFNGKYLGFGSFFVDLMTRKKINRINDVTKNINRLCLTTLCLCLFSKYIFGEKTYGDVILLLSKSEPNYTSQTMWAVDPGFPLTYVGGPIGGSEGAPPAHAPS